MSLARYLASLLNSSGQVPDAKLVALTASKLSGQVPDANAPSGSVIQVVQQVVTANYSGTSGAEVYTGMSTSITPAFANSQILVLFGIASGLADGNNAAATFKVRRGTSTSSTLITMARCGGYANNGSVEWYSFITPIGLDSPATTSSVSYGVFVENVDQNPNWSINNNGGRSCLILAEIAA